MKRTLYLIPMLAAALVATGCSSETEEPAESLDPGTLGIVCSVADAVADAVQTRASGDEAGTVALPANAIPAQETFVLTLTGTYTESGQTGDTPIDYNNDWAANLGDGEEPTVGVFHRYKPLLKKGGSYTAVVSYGDPEAEGPDAAYFRGESTAPIVIKARTTVTVPLTAALANSCFTLTCGEWLTKYYTDIELTVTTGAGNAFTFTPETAGGFIFVQAGTSLKLKGTARKAQTGTEVTFNETTLTAATKAETRHAIVVEAKQVGGATVTVTFDDTFEEVVLDDVEMNPDLNQ